MIKNFFYIQKHVGKTCIFIFYWEKLFKLRQSVSQIPNYQKLIEEEDDCSSPRKLLFSRTIVVPSFKIKKIIYF
jgi:hypothetical protein